MVIAVKHMCPLPFLVSLLEEKKNGAEIKGSVSPPL